MADPQDRLKAWLVTKLKERGPGSNAALADHLGLHPNAITRMKNLDGAREQRSIEAHFLPMLAGFFGEWPPGYTKMADETDKPEELVAKAGGQSKGRKTARKRAPSQRATKDVVVQGVEGPVTVIDNSTNVTGDDNTTVAGHAPAQPSPGAAELMGDVLIAIEEVYKAAKRKLPALDELGRLAYERHAQIVAACQTPDEFPHALEIMKLRLRRDLDGEDDTSAN